MANDRLTRQELSWLLAQEARGAAKALRQEVTILTRPSDPPAAEPSDDKPAPINVELNLDALDGAIGMLSQLQSGKPEQSRRGRIDLAALLYEVVPDARIALKPGEGTEVLGDENELRRVLHVLVHQSAASVGPNTRPEVSIRRDGDWVRVSVDLGPDSSPGNALEDRWLSRMALQHGGRLEFERGTQTLVLPADGASDKREVAELRRELEQAQQLGEAYARELASVFTQAPPTDEVAPTARADGVARLQLLSAAAGALARPLSELLQRLEQDSARVTEALGEHDAALRLQRHVGVGHEILREVRRIGDVDAAEQPRDISATQVVKRVIAEAEGVASRRQVTVEFSAPSAGQNRSLQASAFATLCRTLLDEAIAATPNDQSVNVSLSESGSLLRLSVTDGGPSIPEASRAGLLALEIDPQSLGRPAGLSLLVAGVTADRLGGTLQLGEAEDGRTQICFELGREN